jgi:hypothetical protein
MAADRRRDNIVRIAALDGSLMLQVEKRRTIALDAMLTKTGSQRNGVLAVALMAMAKRKRRAADLVARMMKASVVIVLVEEKVVVNIAAARGTRVVDILAMVEAAARGTRAAVVFIPPKVTLKKKEEEERSATGAVDVVDPMRMKTVRAETSPSVVAETMISRGRAKRAHPHAIGRVRYKSSRYKRRVVLI